jgi:hypothetical protein
LLAEDDEMQTIHQIHELKDVAVEENDSLLPTCCARVPRYPAVTTSKFCTTTSRLSAPTAVPALSNYAGEVSIALSWRVARATRCRGPRRLSLADEVLSGWSPQRFAGLEAEWLVRLVDVATAATKPNTAICKRPCSICAHVSLRENLAGTTAKARNGADLPLH